MATLKGVEKINRMFSSFMETLGYPEIECFLANDFAYYENTEEISYSIFSNEILDDAFIDYLHNTYGKLPEISFFTFSFLHELGHHITLPCIKKKVRRKIKKQKQIMERKNYTSDKDMYNLQMAYCKLLDERMATKEAVKILFENVNLIQAFDKKFAKEMHKFFKENNISNS